MCRVGRDTNSTICAVKRCIHIDHRFPAFSLYDFLRENDGRNISQFAFLCILITALSCLPTLLCSINLRIGQKIPISGCKITLVRTLLRLIYGNRTFYILLIDVWVVRVLFGILPGNQTGWIWTCLIQTRNTLITKVDLSLPLLLQLLYCATSRLLENESSLTSHNKPSLLC